MSELYDDPPRKPAWPFFAAVGFAGALVLVVAGVIAVAALQQRAGADIPTPASPGSATQPAADVGDPWPECAAVRAWLNENSGDPKSVEIVKWERRYTMPQSAWGPGVIQVVVKYRASNKWGGKTVTTDDFYVKNNVAVGHTYGE